MLRPLFIKKPNISSLSAHYHLVPTKRILHVIVFQQCVTNPSATRVSCWVLTCATGQAWRWLSTAQWAGRWHVHSYVTAARSTHQLMPCFVLGEVILPHPPPLLEAQVLPLALMPSRVVDSNSLVSVSLGAECSSIHETMWPGISWNTLYGAPFHWVI